MFKRRKPSPFKSAPGTPKPDAAPLAPGATITALVPHSRDPNRIIVKSGRRVLARIRIDDATPLGINKGVAVTETLLKSLEQAEQRADARRYAFNAVAHRNMSRRTLIGKLRRRGVDEPTAAGIADDLAAKGILDEAAYAKNLVENELIRKPAGKTLLVAKLRSRGVEDKTARATVDKAVNAPDYNARDLALAFAERKARTLLKLADPLAAKRRLYGQLARRGFDPETCAWATKKALSLGGTDRK